MSDYIERVKAIETVKFYDGDPDGIPWAIRSLNDIPAADVVLRSETCPYFVHNEHDRGNDSICRKAGCEVEAVRPVVRCCDCDLWNEWDHAGHESLGNFRCSCAYWSVEDGVTFYTAPTDFCSNGEKRMDGDEDDKM